MTDHSRTWMVGFPLRALKPELRDGGHFPFRFRLGAEAAVRVGDSIACCIRFRGKLHLHALLLVEDLQREGAERACSAAADGSIYLSSPEGPVIPELRLPFDPGGAPRLLEQNEIVELERIIAACRPRFRDTAVWRAKTLEVGQARLGHTAEWQQLEHPRFADLVRAMRSTIALSELPSLSTRDTSYFEAAECVAPTVGVPIDDLGGVDRVRVESGDIGPLVPITSAAQLADWRSPKGPQQVGDREHGGLEHQALLRAIFEILVCTGASAWRTPRVDLGADAGSAVFLFEAKCTSFENRPEQVRTGVGQLLEYHYRLLRVRPAADVRLTFVTRDLPVDDFSRRFLAALGIACVDVSRPADLATLTVAVRAATTEPLRLAATH